MSKLIPRIVHTAAADDGNRTEARGEELRAVEMFAYYQNALHFFEPRLQQRLKSRPNLWRQYRMIESCADKLLSDIYDTLPVSTMDRIIAGANSLEIRIMPKSVRRPEEYSVIKTSDFITLLKAVGAGECTMCLGDRETAVACPLRRILKDYIAPDGERSKYGGCPYAGGALEQAMKKAAGE